MTSRWRRPPTPPAPPAAPAPLMIRADAVGSLLSALRNNMTGAGGENDPATAWVPGVSSRVLWPVELEALDEGTIASIVVREPALWLSCAGIQMDTTVEDDGPMLDRFGKLKTSQRFALANNKARLLGGAGLVMLPRVPQPLDRPLDPKAAGGLRALVPYGADELRVLEIEERLSARKGEPLWYQIDQRKANDDRDSYWSGRIHWSHVLPFYGHRLLAPKLSMNQWSQWPAISVIQVIWDALRDFYAQRAAAGALGRRASTFIVTFQDYLEKSASDPAALEALMTLITQTMGADGNFYGPPGAKVDTASLNLSGQDALARDARITFAAASGIPGEVVFLAETGSVFAGSGWWKIWTTRLTGAFDANYADNYRRVYELEAPFVYPGERAELTSIKPGDFSAPTDLERMQARVLGAQEVATLKQAGLDITDVARKGRYMGPWSPSLPAMEEAPAPPPTQAPGPVLPAADAVDPTDIPSDTAASDFAEQMNALHVLRCRHQKTNRCTICGIERLPLVEVGPDGEPVYPVRWRAIGARADAGPADVWIGLELDPAPFAPLVSAAGPSLRPEPWPHVTLLFLGAAAPGALSAACAVCEGMHAPATVTPTEAGPLGTEGAQVLFLRRAGLAPLADRLLRALAPHVVAEQFPRFIPHATIGYGEMGEVEIPPSIPVRALVVRQGQREVGRYPVGKGAP